MQQQERTEFQIVNPKDAKNRLTSSVTLIVMAALVASMPFMGNAGKPNRVSIFPLILGLLFGHLAQIRDFWQKMGLIGSLKSRYETILFLLLFPPIPSAALYFLTSKQFAALFFMGAMISLFLCWSITECVFPVQRPPSKYKIIPEDAYAENKPDKHLGWVMIIGGVILAAIIIWTIISYTTDPNAPCPAGKCGR